MPPTSRLPRVLATLMTGAALLALCACTGGDDGASGDGTPSDSQAANSVDPAQLSADLLNAGVAATEEDPIASSEGTVLNREREPTPARVDILSVARGPTGTLLRWRLSSPSGEIELDANAFDSRGAGDTESIALVAAAADTKLFPYGFRRGEETPLCICSNQPISVGPDGDILYGLYPTLPQGTTSVGVEIPGFALIENVAVTDD